MTTQQLSAIESTRILLETVFEDELQIDWDGEQLSFTVPTRYETRPRPKLRLVHGEAA